MEVGLVKHGPILGSEPTLGTVVGAFRSFRYADTFKVEPLVRAVGSVAADHLRHLIVRAAAVAVESVRILERRDGVNSVLGKMDLG